MAENKSMNSDKQTISIVKTDVFYPDQENNFRPDRRYPEYPFTEISTRNNSVYSAVRESLYLLEMDKNNYNTPDWNPLGSIIEKGDTVLIKPNLVMDVNGIPGEGTECLFTHPSVVAAVVDYVIIALNGTGTIIIGDAPMQECNFDNILNKGYRKLVSYYKKKNININIVDFRELKSERKRGVHIASVNARAKGKVVDLGNESEFRCATKKEYESMRITNYDPRILSEHHNEEKNEYYISEYILQADVIINMPKPKSHRKAGVTISLKNFVGANVRKEFLPHHTIGSLYEGGDEYLNISRLHSIRSIFIDRKNICETEKKYMLARFYWIYIKCCSLLMKINGSNIYSEGSWYGNNTISRTISDINKIVKYADKNGHMRSNIQRKMFIVADMIVSGESEGPVYPTAKAVGIIACGYNPVSFDRAIATLMGFNPNLIPTITVAENIKGVYKLVSDGEVSFVSNSYIYSGKKATDVPLEGILGIKPSSGWLGHIEINENPNPPAMPGRIV